MWTDSLLQQRLQHIAVSRRVSRSLVALTALGSVALIAGCNDGSSPDDDTNSPAPIDGDSDGVESDTDCNDADDHIYPGATEICDGQDNNCDTVVDEGLLLSWYQDSDLDEYGNSSVTIQSCEAPSGFVQVGGDCDDTDAAINPGALADECLTRQDMNCDGQVGLAISSEVPIVLNLDPVNVTFSVTLGGAPIGTNNASLQDFGEILLREQSTGELFSVGDLWDVANNVPRPTFVAPVLPGTYDVVYSVKVNGPFSPDNEEATLKRGVSISGDSSGNPSGNQSVAVDIPYVTIAVTLTLNGKTVNNSNTSVDDYGRISLRDVTTSEKFPLFDTFSLTSGQATGSYSARLIPTTYDVIYENQSRGDFWPLNEETRLIQNQALNTSGSLSLNVPTVEVTTTVTLGGKSVSGGNTTGQDYGRLDLRDLVTGDTFELQDVWSGSQGKPVATDTAVIIPGTYDLIYAVEQTGSNWPRNKEKTLQKGLALTAAKTQTVDIPVVSVTVSATLDGQAITAQNTSELDFGQLRFTDAEGGDFKALDAFDLTTGKPTSSRTIPVVPGSYDVQYVNKSPGTHWPLNELSVLKRAVDLSKTTTLAVDVPATQLTCDMTLNGLAISSSNTSATDFGKVVLRESVTQDKFTLCAAWNITSNKLGVPVQVTVIPGTYDLLYDTSADGAHWPGNLDTRLQSALTVTEGQTLKLDVPVRTLELGVTLEGAPVSSANTSLSDFGTLELLGIQDDNAFVALSTYDFTTLTVTGSKTLQLLPSSYTLYYQPGVSGSHWPNNPDRVLGCFVMP